MKILCYHIVEKRKRETKNVSIFQSKECKSDANLTSAIRLWQSAAGTRRRNKRQGGYEKR